MGTFSAMLRSCVARIFECAREQHVRRETGRERPSRTIPDRHAIHSRHACVQLVRGTFAPVADVAFLVSVIFVGVARVLGTCRLAHVSSGMQFAARAGRAGLPLVPHLRRHNDDYLPDGGRLAVPVPGACHDLRVAPFVAWPRSNLPYLFGSVVVASTPGGRIVFGCRWDFDGDRWPRGHRSFFRQFLI